MQEEKLAYSSVSSPVKIGDTVHRQAGPWTPSIHALLDFLQAHQFGYSPAVQGMDEQGREVLEFLPGQAASRPWPPELLEDNGLIQAGTMLARYHALVKYFQPTSNARWRIGEIQMQPDYIIRHGDLGPWNTLWQNGKLTGLIDWDFAEPGKAITDLAQMVYYFVPLRGEGGWQAAGFSTRPDLQARLKVLQTAYGQFTTDQILDEVALWLKEELRRVEQLGRQKTEPWVSFLQRGDDQELQQDIAWLAAFRNNS